MAATKAAQAAAVSPMRGRLGAGAGRGAGRFSSVITTIP
jgi:hypothetical protein